MEITTDTEENGLILQIHSRFQELARVTDAGTWARRGLNVRYSNASDQFLSSRSQELQHLSIAFIGNPYGFGSGGPGFKGHKEHRYWVKRFDKIQSLWKLQQRKTEEC